MNVSGTQGSTQTLLFRVLRYALDAHCSERGLEGASSKKQMERENSKMNALVSFGGEARKVFEGRLPVS